MSMPIPDRRTLVHAALSESLHLAPVDPDLAERLARELTDAVFLALDEPDAPGHAAPGAGAPAFPLAGGLRDQIAAALEAADYRMDMRRGDLADAVLPVVQAAMGAMPVYAYDGPCYCDTCERAEQGEAATLLAEEVSDDATREPRLEVRYLPTLRPMSAEEFAEKTERTRALTEFIGRTLREPDPPATPPQSTQDATDAPPDRLREQIARAIAADDGHPWNTLAGNTQEHYRDNAAAALAVVQSLLDDAHRRAERAEAALRRVRDAAAIHRLGTWRDVMPVSVVDEALDGGSAKE